MTTHPSLQRALIFIGERLVKASREAQMRPSKNAARRLRSLEMLAATCVADAARSALAEQRRLRAEPPEVVVRPPAVEIGPPPDVRGAWAAPDE